ncbi:MAG: hypothetical protein CSA62_11465 [Planctomycetota bacterium]|nr:MAG: hypothetical protein CSA62_11465 [Planctomycetota bacterium]
MKKRWILAMVFVLLVAAVDFWLRRSVEYRVLVLGAEGSQPVPGAQVEIYAQGVWRFLGATGEDGRVLVPASGALRLRARAEGLRSGEQDLMVPEEGDAVLRLRAK